MGGWGGGGGACPAVFQTHRYFGRNFPNTSVQGWGEKIMLSTRASKTFERLKIFRLCVVLTFGHAETTSADSKLRLWHPPYLGDVGREGNVDLLLGVRYAV